MREHADPYHNVRSLNMTIKIVMYAKSPVEGSKILDFALHHGAVIESYSPKSSMQIVEKPARKSFSTVRVAKDEHNFRPNTIRELAFNEVMAKYKVGDEVPRADIVEILEQIEGGTESMMKGLLIQGILEPA
jgi:hypothetical protein